MEKSPFSFIILLTCCIIFTLFSLNYNYVNEAEKNQCLMTWMIPSYIKLNIPEEYTFEKKWSQYLKRFQERSQSNNLKELIDLPFKSNPNNLNQDSLENFPNENIEISDSSNKDETLSSNQNEKAKKDSSFPGFNENAHSFHIKDYWKKPSFYDFYLYRESKDYSLELKGVPVLFLHGNSGSFRQARSLGSGVVLNEDLQSPFNDPHIDDIKERFGWFSSNENIQLKDNLIDLFTLDFKEEFSGLHAELIERQALYVNDAIDFILNGLYKNTKHDSVIIVAHSMGGIVARMVPMMINYKPGSVNTIFTLSTPHIGHPFYIEDSMLKLAAKINSYWIDNIQNPTSDISNIAVVSIASGFRDSMIRDDMTKLHDFIPETHQISISAYEIPGVRVACDHMSVIWCKQLTHMLSLAILKLVTHKDNLEYRLTIDHAKRMQILRQTFLGSRPTSIVHNLARRIPSFDPHDIIENEPIPAHLIFENSTIQIISLISSSYIIDQDVFQSNEDKIFSIDIEPILKSGSDFVSIYCNAAFMDYQVIADLAIGRDEKQHKFFDLKEYGEILPHVIKENGHLEIKQYPPTVAKSLYHLPVKALKDQYGYKRILIRFSENLNQPRCIISPSNSETSKEVSYVSYYDVPTSLLSGRPYYFVGTFTSATQKIHFPNLARHLPYTFRVLPVNECPNALKPSFYYLGISSTGERIQERWQTNSNHFSVKFSSSTSDDLGFYVLIESDPCWDGFTLEVRMNFEQILPFVVYYQKNRMGSFMIAWGLLVLAIQAKRNYIESFSKLLSHPRILLGVFFPITILLSLTLPKIESLITYLLSNSVEARIVYPMTFHQASPFYVGMAAFLGWIMISGFSFAIDLVLFILKYLFYLPSIIVRRYFTSPEVLFNPLFKIIIIVSTLLLFRLHAGLCLFIVLLSELIYSSFVNISNSQRSYVALTTLLSALNSLGAVLWIFEVKNQISEIDFSVNVLLRNIPQFSFANPGWYTLIPFFIILFFNFTEETPKSKQYYPILFAALGQFIFSTTPYLSKIFISFAMILGIASLARWEKSESQSEVSTKRPNEANHYEVKVKGE